METNEKNKGGKDFQLIVLDGTVRLVRRMYHARCPDGQVIPCIIGFFGDQLGLANDTFVAGSISSVGNTNIREHIQKKFDISEYDMDNLQELNDDGDEDGLAKALIDVGVVHPDSEFHIELVNPEPDDGPHYISLDDGD